MTKEEFNNFWASQYPHSLPISHVFKRDYPERWFRIHSLPQSKRYAEDEIEWEVLLQRQNTIISDIFGENLKVFLITGSYSWKMDAVSDLVGGASLRRQTLRERNDNREHDTLRSYIFTTLEPVDLYEHSSEYFEAGTLYTPRFTEVFWRVNQYDNLLKSIANDELRAFFVSPEKSVTIAPYDGGIDIILKDVETKQYYRSKYSEWLSDRADGS